MMESASNRLGAAVLILAGVYQWTPLKETCLSHCRSPLLFIQQHGGFRVRARHSGFRHGIYCIGFCRALMARLFVGGVMNLRLMARIAGLGFIVSGAWLLAKAFLGCVPAFFAAQPGSHSDVR
jgi:predicted metal-binding membrane protein